MRLKGVVEFFLLWKLTVRTLFLPKGVSIECLKNKSAVRSQLGAEVGTREISVWPDFQS
jgi:hypothetical protein